MSSEFQEQAKRLGTNLNSRMNSSFVQSSEESFTIQQMLMCNMHLGHSLSKHNKKMSPFIFGEREGIHIINLERSLILFRTATAALEEIVKAGGNIVFVVNSEFLQRLCYETAINCGQYYINGPWTAGLIRNREFLLGDRKYLPDLIVVFDYATNPEPIKEAFKEGIPSIAICDTDCDPSLVTYPIPANDDSFDSVELVAKTLARAVNSGKNSRLNAVPNKTLTDRLKNSLFPSTYEDI